SAPPASSRHSDARLAIDPQKSEAPRPTGIALQDQEKLIAALLEGMGLNNGHATPIDEEQMRVTGRMLSLFSQGTVALLSSRQILKRGVKADMTMILNEANNPFKILPSGKTVLMQMYQSQMPGFMPPEQAVRDALVDLQAHQLGMIAGIRAIIAAMLQSFNPQRLEEQARSEGVLPKLPFSVARKAALWDYFTRNYQRTAGEIEDDFHTLFGEAFLHAYDVEVNQYKDSQTRTDDA
ncbi:type VI secretion system-associated FHA domain protein TagH, partial [Pantoea septica]